MWEKDNFAIIYIIVLNTIRITEGLHATIGQALKYRSLDSSYRLETLNLRLIHPTYNQLLKVEFYISFTDLLEEDTKILPHSTCIKVAW